MIDFVNFLEKNKQSDTILRKFIDNVASELFW